VTAAEEGVVKGWLPSRPKAVGRRKIYRGSERESRSTNIDGFHCWPHERCFNRESEPIDPVAMLGDSAAAVSAMTAAWGCLFTALTGFRKKASSCEGARPPSPGWAFAISNPTLRKAAERLATLHTPEGVPLPPNVSAELQRDMARLGFVMGQIRDIEDARRKRLEPQPETGPHAMVRLLNRVVGVGIETADMLVHEVLSRPMRDRKR
jgi:hypothetical protein